MANEESFQSLSEESTSDLSANRKKRKAEEEVCNVSYRRRSRNTKLGLGIDLFLMSRGIVELL